uniref:Uncharacterized protein n=1 Tax=Chrysotila carterae TaxID=13221 RepID=A0A7S4C3U2_CHRCT
MYSSTPCFVTRQLSKAPCLINQTFGCTAMQTDGVDTVEVWVKQGCRARVRCKTEVMIDCGYWGGKLFKNSKCPCIPGFKSGAMPSSTLLPAAGRAHPRIQDQHRRQRGRGQSPQWPARGMHLQPRGKGTPRGGRGKQLDGHSQMGSRGGRSGRGTNAKRGEPHISLDHVPASKNCSLLFQHSNHKHNCTLKKTFNCVASPRGYGLVDIVTRHGCGGVFSCGGYSKIFCYARTSPCFCPPARQEAEAAVITSHGALAPAVKKLIISGEGAPEGPLYTTRLNGTQQDGPRPPARPSSCRDRLLPSPLLSTESEGALRTYLRGGRFKRVNTTAKLFPLVRRGFAAMSTHRYRSCAVVGSSSKLLDREDGDEIDSAEIVIRIGHAPTPPALQKHVGSRTDVYIDGFYMRPPGVETCPSNKWDEQGNCSGAASDQQILHCVTGSQPLCINHSQPNGMWDRTSPALEMYAQSLIFGAGLLPPEGNRPTTGVIAVLLALHRCDLTLLYGFGPSSTQRCAKYYHSKRMKNCNPDAYLSDRNHNMPLEHAWLRFLTKNFTETVLTCHDLPRVT